MKKSLLALAVLTTLSGTALAAGNKAGDIVVRGGYTNVSPDSDTSAVFVNGANSGLTVNVDDGAALGLNLVYFFDSNWAVELLAATPFEHDVQIQTPAGEATLAEVKHLPPTLSALYYFDTNSNFKPYVGAGLNYTVFFDEEFKSDFSSQGFDNLDLDGSFGLSFQVGADYHIDEKWSVNASVRYIDIDTDTSFTAGGVPGNIDVKIDPYVYSLMIGYKF